MADTTGIYICAGCRIGDALDTESLVSTMEQELQPGICKCHASLCSPEGMQNIATDITDHNIESLVIAGCGKGTKDDVFSFGEKVRTERVNLREWVTWAMAPGEDMQMAAEDYVRMGFAGLANGLKVKPFILEEISKEILVMGGGVTGLKAALDGAACGYRVHLVEKSDKLGGWAAKWKQQIPFDVPFDEPVDPVVHGLIEAVSVESNIRVYLETTVEKTTGQPGAFTVLLSGEPEKEITVGAIVTASGWNPYDPGQKKLYGLGELNGVITSVQFEEELDSETLNPTESVLFVQCAGSRDKEHLPYCSNVCCSISLKQARQVRSRFPDTLVYIIYKDIRTPGFMEDFYKSVQHDPGIIFVKGDVETISTSGNQLEIKVQERLIGEEILIKAGKVVLATGMVPNDTKDLHLGYRLGEGIPELKYDFSDSHFICFPYESRRTGIYAAGGVRAPMDIPSAMADGAGAMMKAIQMVESAERGDAVHPRAGDRSFPELYLERCTDCKRCTEECPFGTYDETPSGTPVVNPNRCRRCGICVGACPERVISFADFSIRILSEKIKSVSVPDEFEEKPRILLFVCENDALPALELAARKGLKISPYVRIIPVRCLGSINRVWVSDALSKGYDGILQLGCKPGDDYQCHFIHGSELTEQRSEIYEETLSSMMLEPERIRTGFVEITDYKSIIQQIDDYVEEVDLMGPNPFKDM